MKYGIPKPEKTSLSTSTKVAVAATLSVALGFGAYQLKETSPELYSAIFQEELKLIEQNPGTYLEKNIPFSQSTQSLLGRNGNHAKLIADALNFSGRAFCPNTIYDVPVTDTQVAIGCTRNSFEAISLVKDVLGTSKTIVDTHWVLDRSKSVDNKIRFESLNEKGLFESEDKSEVRKVVIPASLVADITSKYDPLNAGYVLSGVLSMSMYDSYSHDVSVFSGSQPLSFAFDAKGGYSSKEEVQKRLDFAYSVLDWSEEHLAKYKDTHEDLSTKIFEHGLAQKESAPLKKQIIEINQSITKDSKVVPDLKKVLTNVCNNPQYDQLWGYSAGNLECLTSLGYSMGFSSSALTVGTHSHRIAHSGSVKALGRGLSSSEYKAVTTTNPDSRMAFSLGDFNGIPVFYSPVANNGDTPAAIFAPVKTSKESIPGQSESAIIFTENAYEFIRQNVNEEDVSLAYKAVLYHEHKHSIDLHYGKNQKVIDIEKRNPKLSFSGEKLYRVEQALCDAYAIEQLAKEGVSRDKLLVVKEFFNASLNKIHPSTGPYKILNSLEDDIRESKMQDRSQIRNSVIDSIIDKYHPSAQNSLNHQGHSPLPDAKTSSTSPSL